MFINRWILLSIGTYALICLILYFYASPALTSIVFRLLNFVVMIAVIASVYYFKFYKTTQQAMRKDDLKKEALLIRRDELLIEQKILKKKFEQQDRDCHYLLEKIDSWKASFDKRYREHKELIEQAHIRAKLRAKRQSEWLGRQLAYDAIIKETVKIMQTDLERKFSDVKKKEEFTAQIINFMRKKVS